VVSEGQITVTAPAGCGCCFDVSIGGGGKVLAEWKSSGKAATTAIKEGIKRPLTFRRIYLT